jgi:hypothetical protein
MVLSIERVGRDVNWNTSYVGARGEKAITAITFLGITIFFVWAITEQQLVDFSMDLTISWPEIRP